MEPASIKRLKLLARLTLIWVAAVVLRLLQLQVWHHDYYRELAQDQQEKVQEVQAQRGTIFDRTGQPLAISTPVDSVCVNPMRIPDISIAAEIFSKILDLNTNELSGRIKFAADRRRGFMWVKRKVSPQQAERLRNLKLDWIEFRPETTRFYTFDSLAAHLLGGVDFEERGNGGIEQGLEEDLQGRPGSIRLVV